MAYFVRAGRSTFAPTGHVGGAWDPAEQHIAPSLGLLLHVVEADRDARRQQRSPSRGHDRHIAGCVEYRAATR